MPPIVDSYTNGRAEKFCVGTPSRTDSYALNENETNELRQNGLIP